MLLRLQEAGDIRFRVNTAHNIFYLFKDLQLIHVDFFGF